MSKDVTYPFDDQPHPEGLFGEVPLPKSPHVQIALSVGRSNMVPLKVAADGTLHYAVFAAAKTAPITDVVFRIDGDVPEHHEAMAAVNAFTKGIRAAIRNTGRHMSVRVLYHPDAACSYMVLRFYFDSDFACTEHPEMLLGLPTRPYTCPVCHTMQISGLPHIEDTSE